VTEVRQNYLECPTGYSGGVSFKSNTQSSDQVTVIAAKVEVWPEEDPDGVELWYFNGATPENYPTEMTLVAEVEPTSAGNSFSWYKVSGGTKYQINPGLFSSRAKIISQEASDTINDCKIRAELIVNSQTIGGNRPGGDWSFTIDTCDGAEPNGPTLWDSKGEFGCWRAFVFYKLKARFGEMRRTIEYHEEFFDHNLIYPNSNWHRPDPGRSGPFGGNKLTVEFEDEIQPCVGTYSDGFYNVWYIPQPTENNNFEWVVDETLVDTYSGTIRVASRNTGEGVSAVSPTWFRKIGYGGHR
jgi:hypothetical protein